MRRIPFPLESYSHPSVPLSAKRLINLYAEQEPADARTAAALVSTPGTRLFRTVGTGPIKALNDDMPNRIYIVSGTRFYRLYVDTGGSVIVDDLGEIGIPDDPGVAPYGARASPTIASGPTAAVVVVAPRAYTCTHEPGAPINQLGGTFPVEGASSVAFLDGYYGFTTYGNSAQWFISGLLDPTDYDALDFVHSDAMPNVMRRIISHRGQFWTIGEAGIEVWYDAGNADFPFRRAPGGVISIGTASPMTVCSLDGSVWWLGIDGVVYRSRNYQAERVSTHAIEEFLADFPVGHAATAYVRDGHSFYCLTRGNRTFCYDVATKVWHERSSSLDGEAPWLIGTCAVTANSFQLFGDRTNGNIYRLDNAKTTEDEAPVIRRAALPPLWAGTNRAFCARLEIEMEVGTNLSNGPVLLEWSDDGGHTWTGQRTLASGPLGGFRKRMFTTRLGSFRQRVFRIAMTQGAPTFYAVAADIAAGEH